MLRRLLFGLTLLYIGHAVSAATPVSPAAETGAKIFRRGVLPSGEPLQGERVAGATLSGEAAACTNCHRRSGLGTTEGQIVIPPIIGKYLFRPLEKNVKDLDLPHVYGVRTKRSPYTDETLVRAIRDGIDSDGRTLNYLMPHFKLDDASMTSLITYLKELTSAPVPGVTEDTLHFATIITPDANPLAAKGMLDVLQKFIEDKNEFIRGGARTMASQGQAISYRVTRRWALHVWELTGAPATWQQQLHEKLIAEPVFAVLSGIGGKTWEPVHRFCEAESVPCLFPNVELPIDAEKDFYSMYLSKGVLLEPALIAHNLQSQAASKKITQLIQVYRKDDIGASAAQALQSRPELAGVKIINKVLPASGGLAELSKAVEEGKADEVLVLWLRPTDLAALPTQPGKHANVYMSGTMGTLEDAPLPAAWRSVTHMAYPVDLPELRRVRLYYPLGWFKIRHIPVVAERVQTDTYLACGIVSEMLNEMVDSFVRDYLLERTEAMLSHRLITGYYPRLGLAQKQRFASKGGYLVHFTEAKGNKIKADTDWVIP